MAVFFGGHDLFMKASASTRRPLGQRLFGRKRTEVDLFALSSEEYLSITPHPVSITLVAGIPTLGFGILRRK